MSKDSRGAITKGKDVFEELKKISTAAFRGRSIPVAVLLVLVALLSLGSGLYAGASFFPQQAPNVTITTTIFTTTTSLTTSTTWSTVTSVVYGVWTTLEYTTSTSTVTITGGDTYTKLLLHMDGTDGSQTFVNSSPQAHSITAKGNARIVTAQSEFGGASGLFHGSGDYLSLADSPDWALTGDFTIDFWIRFNSLPSPGTNETPYSQVVDANNRYCFSVYNTAGIYQYQMRIVSGGKAIIAADVSSNGLSTNTWYHIAWVRSGSSFYVFQNGIQASTTQTGPGAGPDLAAAVQIGSYGTTLSYVNGWIDEFRISNGIARWTSNFTPPTVPY